VASSMSAMIHAPRHTSRTVAAAPIVFTSPRSRTSMARTLHPGSNCHKKLCCNTRRPEEEEDQPCPTNVIGPAAASAATLPPPTPTHKTPHSIQPQRETFLEERTHTHTHRNASSRYRDDNFMIFQLHHQLGVRFRCPSTYTTASPPSTPPPLLSLSLSLRSSALTVCSWHLSSAGGALYALVSRPTTTTTTTTTFFFLNYFETYHYRPR